MNRSVVRLTLPIVLSSSIQTIFGVVDMLMVGQLGKHAVGAVGFVSQFLFIQTAIIFGLSMTCQLFIVDSQKDSNQVRINVILGSAIAVSILSLLPMFAICFRPLVFFGLFVDDPNLIASISKYYQSVVLSILFQGAYRIVLSYYIATAKTNTVLQVNSIVVLINVGLNYVFIFGNLGAPRMGLVGAGLATSISSALGYLGLALFTWKRYSIGVAFSQRLFQTIIKHSLPISLEQIIMRTGLFVIPVCITSLGIEVYSSYEISSSILKVFYLPGIGVQSAISVFARRYRKPKFLLYFIRKTYIFALTLFVVLLSIWLLNRRLILGLYVISDVSKSLVLAYTSTILMFIPLLYFYNICVGTMYARGLAKANLLVTFLGLYCLRILPLYIGIRYGLIPYLAIPFIWACDYLFRSLASVVLIRRSIRKV